MENKLDRVQEENLCELVRQFPVIFAKSHKGYEENDAEVDAWNEIANSLDFIPDGMNYILAIIQIKHDSLDIKTLFVRSFQN